MHTDEEISIAFLSFRPQPIPPVLLALPGELAGLHDGLQFGLVAEKQGQVGGQNGMADVAQHLFVLVGRQVLENVVPVILLDDTGEFN